MEIRYVEVKYPEWFGPPIVHRADDMTESVRAQRLERGCTITPLVAMTPERIEALRVILDMAIGDAGDGHYAQIVAEMLHELEEGASDGR